MKEQHGSGTVAKPYRRLFLNRLWALAAAAACLEFGWLTGSLLWSRRRRKEESTRGTIVDAGVAESFAAGEVRAVPAGQFHLACLEDGSFLALSRTCTHLGCSITWNEERQTFVCPCHGSTFDRKGVVLSPPATRPLDYYPVRIENSRLRVDISRSLRRESFNSSQTVKF